ncbi:hypothetical protein AXG93_131s1090 [Marchantia polymorpha subsp. ruderalis]|uniref:Uncharacterized protein n=1 Tax=Marchantia polymorpha subsp. ruderalis TaxID=1480154 RepID=A0A176W031_MARPO|nr:hypothetical protein AXG93_131s1090 [Marchantia polymorpha subsp. ruderalis]
MHRLQSMLDEIEKLDGLAPRVNSPQPPLVLNEFTSVEAVISNMELELDDLDPEGESSPERKFIRRHLEQLIKVASATETKIRDLQDEVNNMREKKPKTKGSTQRSCSPAQSTSSRKRAVPAAGSSECSRCKGNVQEAEDAVSCIEPFANKVFEVTRQKVINKNNYSFQMPPEPGPWRTATDRSQGIWDREIIEKLEDHVKLSKEVEILRRKLEEYKQVLSTSEYQRGSAQATVQNLKEEVKRCREALEQKDRLRKKKKAKPSLRKSGKKQMAQLIIKVCKLENVDTAASNSIITQSSDPPVSMILSS